MRCQVTWSCSFQSSQNLPPWLALPVTLDMCLCCNVEGVMNWAMH